jgi:hypothetical protein
MADKKTKVTVQINTVEKEYPAYVFTVDSILHVPALIESERALRMSHGDVATSATVTVVF